MTFANMSRRSTTTAEIDVDSLDTERSDSNTSIMMDGNGPGLHLVRSNLSAFVRGAARQTADELGFGWKPAVVSPSGLRALQGELRDCRESGRPFRVQQDLSDDTIFVDAHTNWAMRFWHDTRHAVVSANYSFENEVKIASFHLDRAQAAGIGPLTLEYALLSAHTIGQTLFTAYTHAVVIHQRNFVLDCVQLGTNEAIAREQNRLLVGGSAT